MSAASLILSLNQLRTNMKIYQLLEEANIEQHTLSDNDKYLIANEFADNKWVDATKMYLRGIDRQHLVPGDTLLTMAGICDHWREHQAITPRQRMFLVHNLIAYWDQLSLESRAWVLT